MLEAGARAVTAPGTPAGGPPDVPAAKSFELRGVETLHADLRLAAKALANAHALAPEPDMAKEIEAIRRKLSPVVARAAQYVEFHGKAEQPGLGV